MPAVQHSALPPRTARNRASHVAAAVGPIGPYRLAVFSYGLPCPGQKRGGIEQVADDLANALVERGHAVTVFTYDPAPPDARYQVQALPLRGFVTSWLGRRLTMGYLGNAIALLAGYRGFDAIVAHGDSLLLPLTGKPVIRVMHGSAREEARSATSLGRTVLQYGVYLQELLTARLQRGTVGISENTRVSNPFVRRVIPDGIDLDLFAPAEDVRSGTPMVLFVGAMGGRKRGAWLLDRFTREIRPAFPDAELHLVCTPGEPADGVHYHTGLERPALADLYRRAWVYASPSTYEGFGLPYVEAMACGTPVVASPNPGSLEVLSGGRYGLVVDDDAFVPSVCRLLGSRAERDALGRAGLARAADYDIRRSAAAYEAVIEELVGHG